VNGGNDPEAATDVQRDLLAQLGLAPGADERRIAEAHAALLAYLANAPKTLRGWARRQQTQVEAAYQVLQRQPRNARAAAPAVATGRGFLAADADDAEELLDALDDSARTAPGVRIPRQPHRSEPTGSRRESGSGASISISGRTRRFGLAVAGLAVAVVAVVGIYKLGEPSVPGLTGSPAPAATSGLDEARVLELMQAINTNPKDVDALRELADLYYAAGDNATSRTWLLKVLEIEPNNLEALLGSGATAYNLDDFAAAEQAWQAVIAIDPENIDAHYDLGLMYFSMDPPKLDEMRAAWNKVIELAPDSQLASIVKTHMPDAASSGGPSAAPSEAAAATDAAPTTAPASPAASPS
jgi:tetratricopeptide (TPR) repeat protein